MDDDSELLRNQHTNIAKGGCVSGDMSEWTIPSVKTYAQDSVVSAEESAV